MTLDEAYKLFGISTNSTPADIKKTYRRLVKEWHPDVSGKDKQTSEQMMSRINEAFRVLTDPTCATVTHTRPQMPVYTHGTSVFDVRCVSC